MKNFVFSLERMRSYKEQVLDREKNNLARLRQHRDSIERQITDLHSYREQKNNELHERQRKGMNALELNEFKFYLDNTRNQLKGLSKELSVAEREVERQLQIVINASREVAGLDKLEEKQLEEYRVLETQDNNLQIQEYVISNIVRKRDIAP